ncbi:MAG: aldolase/citrate lyase family protein [Anaeroplasmataceae bacterium]
MNIRINDIISEGVAYGRIVYLDLSNNINDDIYIDEESEIFKFNNAISKSVDELNDLKNELKDNDKEFIDIHIALILDPMLNNMVCDDIKKGKTARKAFIEAVDSFINKINEARSVYLLERVADMEDIKRRVLLHIDERNNIKIEGKFILVVEELYPSLLMSYKEQIVGVIALKGGFTSHSAILCKSREIPYVLVSSFDNIDGQAIIDTRSKEIIINPDENIINKYDNEKKYSDSFTINDFSSFGINILANVSSNDDIKKALKYNMDGIGLYRSEIIFMNLDRPMSYEEQYKIYSEAVALMDNKPITIRTFDIGDDKKLSYINTFSKGIDNYINNKDIFETQIRALIAANKNNTLKIMFPMIETYDEYQYLKSWVLNIKRNMNDNSELKIGMMLETKKAIDSINEFKDVEFISIGTNDLIADLYHVNREEGMNYAPYIRDLLIKLSLVAKHCKENNIYLSICGELASVKAVVKRLYRVGIRNFSVSPAFVKNINQALLEEIEE